LLLLLSDVVVILAVQNTLLSDVSVSSVLSLASMQELLSHEDRKLSINRAA
jgi:hypothetical protein